MNLLISIWRKWSGLIKFSFIIAAFSIWINIAENERKAKIAEKEAAFKLQEADKKSREEALIVKYMSEKNESKCNITFNVKLETFSSDVKIELRVGELGNSFPLVVKQASSGTMAYKGLCPNKYFLAIGNDKDISTTPAQIFEKNHAYSSTVHLTQGVGNMKAVRREEI